MHLLRFMIIALLHTKCYNYPMLINMNCFLLHFVRQAHMSIEYLCQGQSLNTLASGWFWGFSQKKHLNSHVFAQEYLHSCLGYRPGEREVSKNAASLLVCTQKKVFAWGLRFFCEWRHKWKTFRLPWPTLPGPRCQPLGDSISRKFLLQTRLQSESFDTLDNLLGFWVQKLWC